MIGFHKSISEIEEIDGVITHIHPHLFVVKFKNNGYFDGLSGGAYRQ